MRANINWRAAVFAVLSLLGLAAASLNTQALAQEASGVTSGRSGSAALAHVTLIIHKSKNIKLAVPFADAAVGAPDIADIVPMSDREIYILGKNIGTTNILLYGKDKQLIGVLDVTVKLDTGSLGAKIREASGGRDIQVSDVNGNLVLSGNGGDAQTVERAMSIAKALSAQGPQAPINALKVPSSQQVMLKVRIVEASRSAARAFGVRWQTIVNNRLAGVVGTQNPSSKLGVAGLSPGSTGVSGQGITSPFPLNNKFPVVPGAAQGALPVLDVLSGVGGGSPTATIIAQVINTSRMALDVVLSALEDEGVVRRLAEPNLIALSGETADFLAGGSFPVPSVAGGGTGLQQVTIQYQDYGVKLRFIPTVLAQGIIALRLEPEVSDIDPALAIQENGFNIPALTVRRARTTVELRDGQTFAIAGLIQAKNARTLEQVPWLGSVPVLGALFRSSEFQAAESELVVLVSPYLITPVAPGQAQLKTPLDASLPGNDVDFFLNGRTELAKSPPTYTTVTGAEQPVYGGAAPGAPEAEPLPPAGGNPFQQLFGLFGSPPAGPLQ